MLYRSNSQAGMQGREPDAATARGRRYRDAIPGANGKRYAIVLKVVRDAGVSDEHFEESPGELRKECPTSLGTSGGSENRDNG